MFRQGTHFTKTWQIKNTGTCTWGPSYALVYAGGDLMNGPQSEPLPAVAPGDLFNISVDLVAPANGGTYLGDWQFQRPDGTHFGVNSGGIDFIWVKIDVSYIVLSPSPGAGSATTTTPGGSSTTATTSTTCTPTLDATMAPQLLALINQARASQDPALPALTLNAKLSAAAQVHSNDMACNSNLDHTGTDGSTWYTRIQAQGYNYAYASENIYAQPPQYGGTAQSAFTWWMNSPIHRANILNPKVTEIGIGYADVPTSALGGYFTLDFALPKQ